MQQQSSKWDSTVAFSWRSMGWEIQDDDCPDTYLLAQMKGSLIPTRNNRSLLIYSKCMHQRSGLRSVCVCLIFIQERMTQVQTLVRADNYYFWFLQRCKPPCSREKSLLSAFATAQSCLGPVKLGPSQAQQVHPVPHLSKPSPCNADTVPDTWRYTLAALLSYSRLAKIMMQALINT